MDNSAQSYDWFRSWINHYQIPTSSWVKYYEKNREPHWPDCTSLLDVCKLPPSVRNSCFQFVIPAWLETLTSNADPRQPGQWPSYYGLLRQRQPHWPDCRRFNALENLPVEIQAEVLRACIHDLIDLRDRYQTAKHAYNLAWDRAAIDPVVQEIASTAREVQQLCAVSRPDYFLESHVPELTHSQDCFGIEVSYHPSMEHGGIKRRYLFVKTLEQLFPGRQFRHCLEWCSGPGFLGYSMIGTGRCQHLDLADIWWPSLCASQSVVGCEPAQTWHIRRMSDIPAGNTYDLILGNPPWFNRNLLDKQRNTCDNDLIIHREFFHDVHQYLDPNGIIMLCEGQNYLGPEDIMPLLEGTGLCISKIALAHDNWHWFAIITRIDCEC